ncbi:MAG: hypothetical protein AAF846_10560 [Chloroflexota bacterium]
MLDSSLKAQTQDPKQVIIQDYETASDSNTLLIAFGGISGGLEMPVFEFFNITSSLATKRLFVRDLEQAWYQNGLPAIASDVDGVLAYLRQEITEANVKRTVIVGNSAGGYAALLFGHLLEVDTVLSFAPQTFLTRWLKWRHRDTRWREQHRNLWQTNQSARKYRNLRPILRHGNGVTHYHVTYCKTHRTDRIHAEHLQGTPQLSLHGTSVGGHRVIAWLKEQGLLYSLLETAIQGQSVTEIFDNLR